MVQIMKTRLEDLGELPKAASQQMAHLVPQGPATEQDGGGASPVSQHCGLSDLFLCYLRWNFLGGKQAKESWLACVDIARWLRTVRMLIDANTA